MRLTPVYTWWIKVSRQRQARWRPNSSLLLSFFYGLGQCLDLRDGNIDIDAVVQTWECVSGNSNQ